MSYKCIYNAFIIRISEKLIYQKIEFAYQIISNIRKAITY